MFIPFLLHMEQVYWEDTRRLYRAPHAAYFEAPFCVINDTVGYNHLEDYPPSYYERYTFPTDSVVFSKQWTEAFEDAGQQYIGEKTRGTIAEELVGKTVDACTLVSKVVHAMFWYENDVQEIKVIFPSVDDTIKLMVHALYNMARKSRVDKVAMT